VAFLIDKVEQDNLPAVFHIELSNEKMANAIAESVKDNTGREIHVLLLHACHNVTKADFEGGASYLSLMTANVETLKEALH
jgi:zinc transport system substrate-binding protein